MTEKFFELENDSEKNSEDFSVLKSVPKEQLKDYGRAAEHVLDTAVFEKIKEELGQKFEIDPARTDIQEQKMPHHLLTGLKETIIDPLYDGAWIRSDWKAGRYPREQELKSSLKAEMLHHYKTFLFPGYLRYNAATGQNEIEEPRGLNFDIQKTLLEEAGFKLDKAKLSFFEGGKEDEIPEELKKNGLIVAIPDEEREAYEKKESADEEQYRMNAGPAMVLYETLGKAGFFEGLEDNRKKELLGTAIFADIIERGQWLKYTKEDFFDKTKINLFKVNRLLDAEKLSEILGDTLRGVRVDWSDFASAKETVRETIVKASQTPFSQDFVSKYHIESAVVKQKESMETSYRYLKSNRNVKESRFGKIVYVRQGKKLAWKDRLPGNLPAIAAAAPKENGKPAWGERHGYFEISDASFLGYLEEKNANRFLGAMKKAGTESGLNPQIRRIGGWVKFFIPFEKGNPDKFLSWFESKGLALQNNDLERKMKKTG